MEGGHDLSLEGGKEGGREEGDTLHIWASLRIVAALATDLEGDALAQQSRAACRIDGWGGTE